MVRSAVAVLRSIAFYIVFYLGSIPLVLIAVGSMGLSDKRFRATVYNWSRFHRTCAAFFLGIRPHFINPATRGGVIYAVKHESFFEAIDMPSAFDLPVVFAKAELLKIPGWGKAADHFGVIAVDREAGATALRAMIRAAKAYSSSGRPLIIFPEGTRVAHGEQPPLQSGFAGIYKLMGLPVIPVAVNSGPLYQRKWKRPGTLTYLFGEEIPPGLPREEIEARVRAAINTLNA